MAGMGLEGAYGAQGTFEGLKDWMRGQRQQVVQGQQDADRVRTQRLQDEALVTEAADRERTIARQRLLDEQGTALFKQKQTEFDQGQTEWQQEQGARLTDEQMQETFAEIDKSSEIPGLAKIGLKLTIQKTRTVPPQAYQYLKPKESKTVAVDTVENGRHVTKYLPEEQTVNQTFEKYEAPRQGPQGPQPSYQWVTPAGGGDPVYRVPQGGDRQPIKPGKPPTMPAKQQESLINADQSEAVLMQLKTLYEGDQQNADPAKRFVGARQYIGPYAGREKRVMQWAGQDKDKNFALFDAASARLENAIVQAITGAAVGKDEEKRIMREIPRPTDSNVQWEAHWQQSLLNLKNIRGAVHRQAALMGRPLGDDTGDSDAGAFGAPVVLDPRGGAGAPAKPRFTIIDTK